MPLRDAVVGDTVSYRNAAGETTDVVVTGVQVTAPSAPSATGFTTGGTLSAATYSYRVSIVRGGAESVPSTAGTAVVASGTTGRCEVTLPGAAGDQYGIYGRVGGSEQFIALTAKGATTFIDTGAVTPSGAIPTADGRIGALQFHPKRVLGRPSGTVVVKAATVASTSAYFKR